MDGPRARPQRRSIRLQGHDYSQPGEYFVTLCTQDRETRFGEAMGERVALNAAGKMVDAQWRGLAARVQDVALGPHVVMPNHLHGIIALGAPRGDDGRADQRVYAGGREDGDGRADTWVRPYRHTARPEGSRGLPHRDIGPEGCLEDGRPLTLGRVVQWFKTMTTNEYIRGVREGVCPPFQKRLWQRNYWEHIVRGEADLPVIETYIERNPEEWAWDHDNREAMRRIVQQRRCRGGPTCPPGRRSS
jgi:REP element-mobilizing transposase RayT